MSDNELLNPILLSLADGFEAHKINFAGVEIKPQLGEWEPLRELLARQCAAGLIVYFGSGKPSWIVKLTGHGYKTHLPRIQALRTMAGLGA